MKVIDKENNIVEDICPSCGKDGATIQTTEYADGSKYIEVMCLNGCGHFARIIKDDLITEQEYIQTCTMEQLAEVLSNISTDAWFAGLNNMDRPVGQKDNWQQWLKQPHRNVHKEIIL